VIPEDWEVRSLGALAITVSSGTSKTGSTYGEYPVHGSTGEIGHSDRVDYEGSAILVARVGANAGRLNVVSGKYGVTDNTILIRLKPDCHLPFIWRQLELKNLNQLVFGSGQPLITGTQLKALCVAEPSGDEQRAIAEALSDVDGLLRRLEALIAKKQAIKQAAMQQLLTGNTRLPGFSGPWETKRLGEIATIQMGRTPSRSNSALWGRGHVWLSIADLHDKVVYESKEQITDLAAELMTPVPKGTLLMSFKLSIGRLCFAGCDLYTNEAICSFADVKADDNYLYYALSRTDFSLYGKQAVKGYTLNSESLRVVEILVPEISEQTAIATVLSDMDAEIAALERRRDKTRAIKQGMMQQLLTGRVRLL
jgi:type I restriction enzyme S subunit